MWILAPEPPLRTGCSRGGREIPLPIKALLEAGERIWVTICGIRVVPRKFYAPDDFVGGVFSPPDEPKEDLL